MRLIADNITASMTMAGRMVLSIEVAPESRRDANGYTELQGKRLMVEIKSYRANRSLDANAYCWVLCDKIAAILCSTKTEVYRKAVIDVGPSTPLPIRADAVDAFAEIWAAHGTGWIVEVIDDSKLTGYKLVHAYQGSSTYNTAQMSRLIDWLIGEAKQLGIETITPNEAIKMMGLWDAKHNTA